jgi:hypothetical protein
MFAASMGPASNWFDSGTLPITDFVRVGLGRNSQNKANLSDIARSSDDPVVYRHWHGPLYYLWLGTVARPGLNEKWVRFFSLLFPALTAVVMYFGSVWILSGTAGQIAGILASTLFLWSPVTLKTTEIAPHLMFMLWCVGCMLFLAKSAVAGGRGYFYGAVVCSALAFCTLEVAFVPILTIVVFAWWYRKPLRTDMQFALRALGSFCATVLVVWPAALLKLSFVKAYLVMAYLALFRKNAWGEVTLGQTWWVRFFLSPVEWLLIAVALGSFFLLPKTSPFRKGAAVFLTFAALMILATIKVYSSIPRYMTPFFPALELFAAWVIAGLLRRFSKTSHSYAALAVICLLLFGNSWWGFRGYLEHENFGARKILAAIHNAGLDTKAIAVPRGQLPTMHYYFPHASFTGYDDTAEIPQIRSGRHLDGVVYPDYSLIAEPNSLRTEVN